MDTIAYVLGIAAAVGVGFMICSLLIASRRADEEAARARRQRALSAYDLTDRMTGQSVPLEWKEPS